MPPRTKRIYTVAGAHESGKSTAVAQFLPPDKIHQAIIIDTEDSMSDILDGMDKLGLKFGAYIRMYDRFGKGKRESILDSLARGELPWLDGQVSQGALVGYYEYFIGQLNDALKGNLDKPENERLIYLGIDTIGPIEAGLTAWVEVNKGDRKKPGKSGWSGNFQWGKRETEGVRPLYEGVLEGCFRLGVTDFCLASHLKPVWAGKGQNVHKVLNKVKIGGRLSLLSRLSKMMWWLTRGTNNQDGAPSGIRLKARLGEISIIDGKWANRTLIPQRIPHFTWDDVRWYMKNPCDLLHPKKGEVLTKAEEEMISEFLTEEQMKLMVLGAEKELQEARNVSPFAPQPQPQFDDQKVAIRKRRFELEQAGEPDVSGKLREENFPLPLVLAVMKE